MIIAFCKKTFFFLPQTLIHEHMTVMIREGKVNAKRDTQTTTIRGRRGMSKNGTPLLAHKGIHKIDALMIEDDEEQTNDITKPKGLVMKWQDHAGSKFAPIHGA